jgi:hypothetical protein
MGTRFGAAVDCEGQEGRRGNGRPGSDTGVMSNG